MAHKWADITLAAWGLCNTSQRDTKSQVAYKWAGWLHNAGGLGRP